ncbi:NAD(P)-dependent oxidoreductase [Paenibacillus sp. FSL L8-0436]|uniref:NAD(P)-dependent oxidoreductase n=1 Tax=Paenibacillus sp. FSL L8-0436 TaxID=2954686 RepID=UPI003158FE57
MNMEVRLMKVSFIGLGNMGFPMAQNLLKAGYELIIFNRTPEKVEPLMKQGARYAETPLEAAKESNLVITMLSDDAALEEVVEGPNGVLNGLPEKGIHVSASTISVDLARKLSAAHAERKQHFVSATVLGRPDAAKAAALRIILAGPEQARQRVLPVLTALGQEIFEIGEHGEEGNVVKIGVNFLIASMLEALSEAQLMVEKHGIEPARFMDVVNALFQSPIYQNYGAIMTEQRFEPAGFKMKLGMKDVALAIEAAQSVQAPLPLGELIHHHLHEGLANGYGELDWTALIRCLKHSN